MKFVNKRHSNFTTIPNNLIYDPNITWKAKAILIYMISRPPDWQFYLSEVIKNSRDGRDATAAGIKELIEARYLLRFQERNTKGQFREYIYQVYDEPQSINAINSTTLSETGLSVFGKPDATNTYGTNINLDDCPNKVKDLQDQYNEQRWREITGAPPPVIR